jgi:cytochrome o ubiquinol oxidase subunit 1
MLWFMGFIVTFTIGGLTGVLMAVPGIDFQVHNSLFLVAHFHNMIIGGVLFGFFAGVTYWWPKFTGFRLHEGLGIAAFWCWLVGFLLAFLPLYALGLMGAARRLDGYDASLGWQGLFIVAGVGLMVILLGVFFQVVQVGYSIWKRRELRVGSDPWDGRTLEWSTSTPIAEYNYASLTSVTYRDDFWEQKQLKVKTPKALIEPIRVPKNTGAGVFIGLGAFVVGFAIIWHIWWLALVALIATIVVVIMATLREDTETIIAVDEIVATEKRLRGVKA